MKRLILFVCVISTFIGCEKEEKILSSKINNPEESKLSLFHNNKTFNDEELNINTESYFAIEERNIKETIISMNFISISNRLQLCKGVIMENSHISSIKGSAVILEKMSLELKIAFMKKLFPNKKFKIYNNRTKEVEYEYILSVSKKSTSSGANNKEYHGMILEYPSKTGGYGSNCAECGNSSCMHYF